MKSETEFVAVDKDIQKKLNKIHRDVKLIKERSNQQYLELVISNLKKDFIYAINSYLSEDNESNLEKSMVEKCGMRTTCKANFTEFLNKNRSLINQDQLPGEKINHHRDELERMKNEAPFDKCEICFSEVSDLFQKQVKLIRSLNIYQSNENNKEGISLISEESIVKEVLEPLAHKQRIQIIKSLTSTTQTFSNLSQITGLRGGNLLYHLQKLIDKNVIIQRHDRGDYMITDKGNKLLGILTEMNDLIEK